MPISRSASSARIAITLGDPAGIGPEIALKALARCKISPDRFLLLGPDSLYRDLAKKLRLPLRVPCHFPFDFPKKIVRGRSSSALTVAAVRSIEWAVKLAMTGQVRAIVTPPIHKAALKEAGFHIPGHTEYLARLSKTKKFEMMLVGGPLRVVLVTRHIPLKEVSRNLSKKRIVEAIDTTVRELRRSFGIRRPRLGVCSLNPHAGEQGILGKEEIRTIEPAVREAQKKCAAEITGPLSPDVLFRYAYEGRYDAEICMYHDQGQIPLKMISRGTGINITLGLPFVRTSPDHGTGYDIANRFVADPGSMVEAIQLAHELATRSR